MRHNKSCHTYRHKYHQHHTNSNRNNSRWCNIQLIHNKNNKMVMTKDNLNGPSNKWSNSLKYQTVMELELDLVLV